MSKIQKIQFNEISYSEKLMLTRLKTEFQFADMPYYDSRVLERIPFNLDAIEFELGNPVICLLFRFKIFLAVCTYWLMHTRTTRIIPRADFKNQINVDTLLATNTQSIFSSRCGGKGVNGTICSICTLTY